MASTPSVCTPRSTRSRTSPSSACSSSAPEPVDRRRAQPHDDQGFYGAGQEDTTRTHAFTLDAGEPPILLGSDTGPNPAEALLHALAACLTTSLVYVAAARGVRLTAVESTLEGDMDVRGALGLSDEVRNGFERVRVTFNVPGDATPEKLRELVERAQQRSVVFDMVTHGVPVQVGVVADSGHARSDRPHRRRRPPRGACREARPGAGAARPRARPRRVVPAREHRRAQAGGLLHGPDPGRARRPRRQLDARRRRRVEPPGARRRVDDDRRQHALRRPDEHGASPAHRGRSPAISGAQRAFGSSLRGDRARRRDHGHGGQRAGQNLTRPSTTAMRTDSGWRIDGRKIFCTMSPAATVAPQPRSPSPATTASSATATRRSIPPPTACSSTTTGTPSACARPAATP